MKTKSSSASYTHLAPTGLKASSITSEGAKLSWKSRGSGLAYRLTVATKSSFADAKTYLVKGTSKTVKGLLGAKTYYARVQVVTSGDAPRSVNSPKLTLKTKADPAPVDEQPVEPETPAEPAEGEPVTEPEQPEEPIIL